MWAASLIECTNNIKIKHAFHVFYIGSETSTSTLSFLERGMRNCHIMSLKNIADVLERAVKDFL
jgi:hypothetical protein